MPHAVRLAAPQSQPQPAGVFSRAELYLWIVVASLEANWDDLPRARPFRELLSTVAKR